MRIAVGLACLALLGGTVAWIAVGGLADKLAQSAGGEQPSDGQASPEAIGTIGADVRTAVQDGAVTAWRVVRLPAALGVLAILGLLAVRTVARHRRRYVRLRLMPYRAEESTPEEVCRLLESWHQQLVERWWKRPWRGQRSLALELSCIPGGERSLEGRFAIVCPEREVGAVTASLNACYPDSRIVRDEPFHDVRRVIRLKKRHSFIQALNSPREYERVLADSILTQMANSGGAAMVQYVLTPAPGFFDRRSRRLFASRERSHYRDQRDPGLQSELLSRELQGGLTVQHRTLFFAEIRVGARSYAAARAIAGTVRGGSSGENRLVERYMRPWGRGPLYRERMRRGWGNPIPGWRRGVISSSEMSTLWQLPSPGLNVVRFERTSAPRALAPPAISRSPEHMIATDELGPVGIRPEDKSDGLGLIGGQKTGKTSLLIRTVQVDAQDERCALVVLMPKPGDALKALSMVPPDRRVHYLDFEAPELGINPLLAPGDPAMVADKIVEAFRDVNEEGDIRGSSDRFLRQAAQATVGGAAAGAIKGQPSLWDMYRMLLPTEVEFRERVVHALYENPRFSDTVTFFGRDLPHDLRDATVNTTSKLDAPRNKLLRLLVESLDKVLRHPRQLSLDELVSRREVLIVDGKMGTFGPDNCRVMMQFILNMLYGALQRQQQLPEAERVRVALKVDEAHLIMNESFVNALATLRSAGLEVVGAWQYGDQIQDPKIRGGLMSLLRQRCMFSMGESVDVRQMSEIAMNVYVDMIRDDPQSRARIRITPEALYNLPNHHTVCSWISRGARAPAFLAQTLPLETKDDVVEHHLRAQRERGGFVPDVLPDPLPEVAVDGSVDLADAPLEIGLDANGDGPGGDHPEAETQELGVVAAAVAEPPAASPKPAAKPRAKAATGPVPDSYAELDLDDVRGMHWDNIAPRPKDKQPQPTPRELEILVALHRYKVMFATQIWRRWWDGSTLRAAQQGLNRMTRAGWVRRFRFTTSGRGEQQRVYAVTPEGFALAQRHSGPRGPYIPPDFEWRDPGVEDPRTVVRALHANAWVLTLEELAPKRVTYWRGPGSANVVPPRRRQRGEWVEYRPSDLTVGSSRRVRNLQVDRLEAVHPAAAIEVRVNGASADEQRRFDLLIEIERGRMGSHQFEKLRRYDALITGWCRLVERFQKLGTPPVAVFVCEDEPTRDELAKMADGAVTGQVAKAGTESADWPCPGRRTMFFVAERHIHEGSLAAVQMPALPPDVRRGLTGPKASDELREVSIFERRLLGVAD